MRCCWGTVLLVLWLGGVAWGAPPEDHLTAPKISGITPKAFRVDWVAYPAFNDRTHYQVRVDQALYYCSGFDTSRMVLNMVPGRTVKVEVVTYHEGHAIGTSSSTWVLMGPAAPEPLFVTDITSTTFRLTWPAVPTATEYRIYRHPADLLTTVPASQTSVLMGPYPPGASMSVYVVAVNPSSPSFPSKPAAVSLKPPAPQIKVAASDIGQTEFRLTWDPVDSATGYSLYRNGDPDGTASSTATSSLVTGCQPGTVVRMKVVARNASGDSDFSNEVAVLLKPATPARPVATQIGTFSFVLNWTLVGGADSYKIWRDGEWLVANASAPATSVRLQSGFNPGDSASMTVMAHNASGDSGHSDALLVKLLGGASGTRTLAAGGIRLSRLVAPGLEAGPWPVSTGIGREARLADLLGGKPAIVVILGGQPAAVLRATGAELRKQLETAVGPGVLGIVLFQGPEASEGGVFPRIEEAVVADLPFPVVLTLDGRARIRSRSQETGRAAFQRLVQESLWDCLPMTGPAGERLRQERRRFEGLHREP